MSTNRTETGSGRRRRVLALLGGAAIAVSACSGSTASPSGAIPTASAAAATSAAAASQAASSASAAPSDAGYTGPEATITYSIWGDPQEIKNQQAIVDAFGAELSPEALNAAKIAASLMAMNNIYYRFVHLVHAADYKTLPAKLRMIAMAKPGVDKVDFELWSLVVSAINGCGMCLEAHEKVLRYHGLSAEQIQAAVRIAATVHAVARTLSAEEALAVPLAQAA